jgi:signal transduction histidine kinase/ligand-binding sensor domain-containing protein
MSKIMRRRFKIHFFARGVGVMIALCLPAIHTLALDPQKMMTQFQHRHWGAADGVDKIRSITQTTDGYLWVVSGNRLLKFDGNQFTQWTPKAGKRAVPGYLEKIFAGRDGSLWVSYAVCLLRIRDGRSTNYGAAEGMSSGHVVSFCEDANGVLWAGGSEGICKFEKGHWHGNATELGLPIAPIRAITTDQDNGLWASVEDPKKPQDGRIAWRRPGTDRFVIGTNLSATTQSLAAGIDGKIWAAEPGRSVRAFTHDATGIQFAATEIAVGSSCVLVDRDGALWITTLGDGLRRIPYPKRLGPEKIGQLSQDIDHFTQKDGLSSDVLHCAFEDQEGNIWIGTSAGLDCFSENKITAYSTREGLPFDTDLIVQAAPDGGVWAVSNPHGLVKIMTTVQPATSQFSLQFTNLYPVLTANNIYANPSGELLLATPNGVLRAGTNNGDTNLPAAIKGFINVTAMTGDATGGLWVYDRKYHFVQFQNGKLVQRVQPPDLTDRGDYISAAHTDPSGNVWFGDNIGNITCREAGQFREYKKNTDGLFDQQIRQIWTDARGQLWIVSSDGIGRFQNGRFQFLTKAGGLPGEDFVAMLQTEDGAFWLGGMDGIFRIAPGELEKAFAMPHPIPAEHFGFDDGLRGFVRQRYSDRPGEGYPLATKSMDGRLWFSTSAGLAMIDPRHIPKNPLPPPVHIEQIITAGRTNQMFEHLEFPGRTRNYEIDYAALSFVNPGKVRYQYKLDGYDPDWVEAGPRRTAFYANLRPQKYRFQVRACNNDGVWNETGDAVEFSVIPAFYQTTWFSLLCTAILVFALFGLHRLRLAATTSRMNLQLAAQTKERKRIAQELHDTLLQGFTGIGLKLDALTSGLPESLAATKEKYRQILEQSDQYLTEARRSVWQLRSASLEKNADFTKTLAEASQDALDAADIELHFSITGTSRPLKPVIEDNLLRICLEAVTNAVKHARPARVELNLQFDKKSVRLRIHDDGCGFDPQGAAAAKFGHFGLIGIQERVKSLAGQFSLNSRPGQGTEIIVSIHNN